MSNDTGFRTLGPKVPFRVAINSSEPNIDVVEAIVGSKIAVISLVLSANGAGDVVFKSNSTELGRIEFKASDPPLVLPRNSDSWIETQESGKLVIGNSSTLALKGFLTYIVI